MADIAFNRRVKVVIGVPEVQTESYVVQEYVYAKQEDRRVVPATSVPAGKIISISNTPPDSPRAFYFKLQSTRGSTKGGSANEKTTIELANLNEETVGLLHLPNSKVMVYAGYENGDLDLYYTGDIYDVRPMTQGDDRIYQITCKDGIQDAQNTRTSLYYDETMSVAEIITDMAGKFPSSSLGTLALNSLEAKFVAGGVGFQGNHQRNFEKFCKMYGVNYFRYNGKINLQPYQLVNGTPEYLLVGRNNYEINNSKVVLALDPIVQNKDKYINNTNIKRGVQLTTYLIPIELGQFFTVSPEISKDLAGSYKVTTIKLDLNMPKGNFEVTVRGEPM